MRHFRLQFWLFTMDALCWLGCAGGRLWTFALERASDATDWGEGADCGEGRPF
jgi:hypothetical protein